MGDEATEVIYRIKSVEVMSTKIGSAMVVNLVDKNGMSLKVFSTSCLKYDLRDFSLDGEWFIRLLGKWSSSRNPGQSYYHYEIMRH